jgi:hypothetical protein
MAVAVNPGYALPLTYAVRHSVIVSGLVTQSDMKGSEYVSTYVKGVVGRRSVREVNGYEASQRYSDRKRGGISYGVVSWNRTGST